MDKANRVKIKIEGWKKHNMKKNTTNKILLAMGIATVLFTVAMIVIFCMYQSIPETLVERYFTCVVGEGGFTMIIKVVKTFIDGKKCPANIEDIAEDIFELNEESEE